MKMNLGRIIDFNRYVYNACWRVLPSQELNPSTSLLFGQVVVRQSSPNMQPTYITKAINCYSIQFDWNSKNYYLSEIKIQHRTTADAIKCKEMSIYLRKNDQIFSQNQLAIVNQFINEHEFRFSFRVWR